MRKWQEEDIQKAEDIQDTQKAEVVEEAEEYDELAEGFWGDVAGSVGKAVKNAAVGAASAVGGAVKSAAKSIHYKVSSPKKYIEDILTKELDRNGIRTVPVEDLKPAFLQFAPDCSKEGKFALFGFKNAGRDILIVIGKHVWVFASDIASFRKAAANNLQDLLKQAEKISTKIDGWLSNRNICKNVADLEGRVFNLLNVRTPAAEAYKRGFHEGWKAAQTQ